MNNEIIEVEKWSWEWVDTITGNQFFGVLTGTPWKPFPNVQQRYIRTFPNRRVHKGCGGEIVRKWDTKWEGSTSYTSKWDECEICHKRFNERGYE